MGQGNAAFIAPDDSSFLTHVTLSGHKAKRLHACKAVQLSKDLCMVVTVGHHTDGGPMTGMTMKSQANGEVNVWIIVADYSSNPAQYSSQHVLLYQVDIPKIGLCDIHHAGEYIALRNEHSRPGFPSFFLLQIKGIDSLLSKYYRYSTGNTETTKLNKNNAIKLVKNCKLYIDMEEISIDHDKNGITSNIIGLKFWNYQFIDDDDDNDNDIKSKFFDFIKRPQWILVNGKWIVDFITGKLICYFDDYVDGINSKNSNNNSNCNCLISNDWLLTQQTTVALYKLDKTLYDDIMNNNCKSKIKSNGNSHNDKSKYKIIEDIPLFKTDGSNVFDISKFLNRENVTKKNKNTKNSSHGDDDDVNLMAQFCVNGKLFSVLYSQQILIFEIINTNTSGIGIKKEIKNDNNKKDDDEIKSKDESDKTTENTNEIRLIHSYSIKDSIPKNGNGNEKKKEKEEEVKLEVSAMSWIDSCTLLYCLRMYYPKRSYRESLEYGLFWLRSMKHDNIRLNILLPYLNFVDDLCFIILDLVGFEFSCQIDTKVTQRVKSMSVIPLLGSNNNNNQSQTLTMEKLSMLKFANNMDKIRDKNGNIITSTKRCKFMVTLVGCGHPNCKSNQVIDCIVLSPDLLNP